MFCAANATGWLDPGYIHTAVMRGVRRAMFGAMAHQWFRFGSEVRCVPPAVGAYSTATCGCMRVHICTGKCACASSRMRVFDGRH